MLESLLHTKLSKNGDEWTAIVRTEEFGELLIAEGEKKGMKVSVVVNACPHYFRTKQDHVDYLLKTNPDFANFHKVLGLKLL
jgi:membrane-bound lytic murein transglycosylase